LLFAWGATLRALYTIAIVALVLVVFAAKVFLFHSTTAEAQTFKGLDVSVMQVGKNLPTQKLHDMSFVFSQSDE